jgi:hypothetical protein
VRISGVFGGKAVVIYWVWVLVIIGWMVSNCVPDGSVLKTDEGIERDGMLSDEFVWMRGRGKGEANSQSLNRSIKNNK